MAILTYTQLINQTLAQYLDGAYEDAYNNITNNSPLVNGNEAQVYNFRYSIACKLGNTPLALELFKEAVLDKGYWYACSYLQEDDDLEPLRRESEFEALYEMCYERETSARRETKPTMLTFLPENPVEMASEQVLVVLHGNQENAAITKPYWLEALNHGITLALQQSSQIEFSDAYCWDNLEKSTQETGALFNKLMEEKSVPVSNRILGGFSAGARTALYAVLTGVVQVGKLILVSPWFPEFDAWGEILENLKSLDVKIYLFAGSQDEDCLEGSLKLANWLELNEISHEFNLIPGLDHDYPTDFEHALAEILSEKVLAIARPNPSDTEQIHALFETVLKDTYAKNNLDDFKDALMEEINHKKHMLTLDLESNGADLYFLIAKMNDKVVGTIEYGPANEVIEKCGDGSLMALKEIGTLFVLPEYQGMGIGTAMLEAIKDSLADGGHSAFCLDSGYPTAQKIWLKMLGTPEFVLKDYWGEGFDHMVWRGEIERGIK